MINVLLMSVVSSDFVTAVAIGESNMTHTAVGDNGRAHSAWQMHKVAWDDTIQHLAKKQAPWYAWASHDDPHKARYMAQHFLLLQEQRLKSAGIQKPSREQVYLAFTMGFSEFAKCGFDPRKAPAVKLRGLRRVLNATK